MKNNEQTELQVENDGSANDRRTSNIETDYRKWLAFSVSVGKAEMLDRLKRAIKARKTKQDISIARENNGAGKAYYISEKGNSTTLQVAEDTYPEFMRYFSVQYLGEHEQEVKIPAKSKEVHLVASEKVPHEESVNSDATMDHEQEGFGLSLLKKLSSANKLRHAFNFSLIALVIQQLYIIPENFGDLDIAQAGPYSLLVVMLLVWGSGLWAYARFFKLNKSYREIRNYTWPYFAIWWLLAYLEIVVILWIEGSFSLLFTVVLLFLGQFCGAIMALFLSVIAYYFMGGKVVDVT